MHTVIATYRFLLRCYARALVLYVAILFIDGAAFYVFGVGIPHAVIWGPWVAIGMAIIHRRRK